jgi:hypothetical protein
MKHSGSVDDHRAVSRKLADSELCRDLARRYTRQIKYPNKREAARLNYERIASLAYSLRPKPPPAAPPAQVKKFEVLANGMTREDMRWDLDLAAVVNDPHYSIERRKYAQQQRNELHGEIERRHKHHLIEFVTATTSREHWESRAKRWLTEWHRLGKPRFFQRLENAIRRYLMAREKEQSWISDLEFLHLLSIEWLRDPSLVWRFIEACINRWSKIGDPRSLHRRSVVSHQILGIDPEMLKKQMPKGEAQGWKLVVAHLKKIDAVAPGDASTAARLRQMSAREIREVRKSCDKS